VAWITGSPLKARSTSLSASLFISRGTPGKLPPLEGLERFFDFVAELGGSLVHVPSTRYLVDNVPVVAERGHIGESFLGGELETVNQGVVLRFEGAAHGSYSLGECGQHLPTVGLAENDPDSALLALFVGSDATVDEQQVVALLEVIDHKEPRTGTSLALPHGNRSESREP
jgi:hypothetical protein